MPHLSDDAISEIAETLRKGVARHAPEWSDASRGDPGITLLQLFAFLAESLSERQDAISQEAYIASLELTRRVLRLVRSKERSGAGALTRNNYFSGRMLSAEDFALEQDYIRERLRRLSREIHGAGVVRGLDISVEPDRSGQKVTVQPGFALDGNGEEIEVSATTTICLPDRSESLYVILRHQETPSRPVPGLQDETLQFTRIEEGFAVRLEAALDEQGVPLARLLRDGTGWRKDETFAPVRIACGGT